MAAPLLAEVLPPGWQLGEVWRMVAGISPLRAWQEAPGATYDVAPMIFWQSLAISHLVGWLMLVASAWGMARAWRQMAQGAGRLPGSWNERLMQPVTRMLQWLDRPWRRRDAGFSGASVVTPFLMNTTPPAMLLLILLLGGAAALALVVFTHGANLSVALAAAGIFYGLHWVVRFWVAAQSCQALRSLRDSGWLTTLLTAPLAPQELPRALQKSQMPAYRMVCTLLILMELALVGWGVMSMWPVLSHAQWWSLFGLALLAWLAALLILWLDIHALNHAALWHSLNLNQPTAAVRRTIFQVLFLPLLIAPLGLLCSGVALPVFMMVKSLVLKGHFQQRFLRGFREGVERAQMVAPASLGQQVSAALGLKKAPPRLQGVGNCCVACGHSMGDAPYCPLCGYRQPSSESWP
jgi:hypothetical protein